MVAILCLLIAGIARAGHPLEPQEQDNLVATKAWVFRPYMKVIGDYSKSLAKYPNPKGVSLTKFQ